MSTFDMERIDENQIAITAETKKLIAEAKKLNIRMLKDKVKMDAFKEAIKEAMKANGVKSFQNDQIIATYTPEHTTSRLDSKALKEKHPKIYKEFTKETKVADSVRVAFKE